VRAFNFLIAFHISRSGLLRLIAEGKLDASILDEGFPTAVAPFNRDTERAAKVAFDRNTGQRVPQEVLASYREVLASYHLHSEAKFEHGQTTDRGVTERRHIQAIALEYIGKEANRWEEQFFLGEAPETQIEYGTSLTGWASVLDSLRATASDHSRTALACAAGLSRQQLVDILDHGAIPDLDQLNAD
jgi:hypothetical protein